jgi:DNA-binding NarL/FixJ family response regulator
MRHPDPLATPAAVLIVEDHPEFRDVLRLALSACAGVAAVHACRDLPAAQSWLEQARPDLLLVDLGLPSGSGLSLIRLAHRLYGDACPSAVLTVTGNEEHLMTAVGAGAKGYLFKSDTPEQWQEGVALLLRGHSPLHARVAKAMLDALTQPVLGMRRAVDPTDHALLLHLASGYLIAEAAQRLQIGLPEAGYRIRGLYDRFFEPAPDLTPRELELLNLLNRGMTFKQCAAQMGIGEATIKTHAARAYEKLGASNLQMALYEARQVGLLA